VVLHDLNDFFQLSGELNYQLSARGVGRQNVLAAVVDGRTLEAGARAILLEVLEYLDRAYGEKSRRLGPKAVLHPLRASALLVRAQDGVVLLDVLAELLHDKFEDILAEDYEPAQWQELEGRFEGLLEHIPASERDSLRQRLRHLTRRRDETYCHYVGRLLEHAAEAPALVRIKLADRLDNTLDMRIDFRDPLDGPGVFTELFHLLFSRHFSGFSAVSPHPPRPPLDGSRRLYELFKNTVLLSLVRQGGKLADDPGSVLLFDAIATAGMREAQRILMHIFTYHLTEVEVQRRLLLETMDYCWSGGVESVTPSVELHRLDGLFAERFDAVSPESRREQLAELYKDKEMMSAAAVAFMVIFLNFLKDSRYIVQGVTADGITPRELFA